MEFFAAVDVYEVVAVVADVAAAAADLLKSSRDCKYLWALAVELHAPSNAAPGFEQCAVRLPNGRASSAADS